MASVVMFHKDNEFYSEIDYSLNDGRVLSVKIRGEKLYDESDGTAVEGWQTSLITFVKEYALDIDLNGHGLHAFVNQMIADGLLP